MYRKRKSENRHLFGSTQLVNRYQEDRLKHLTTLQKWLAIGMIEIVVSLVLIAIAPIFLNSDNPFFGFCIWLFVPTLLGSSGIYAATRIWEAQKSRSLFVQYFPEYSHIEIDKFLGISATKVRRNLKILEDINNDPTLNDLGISLIDILKEEK